MNYSKLKFALGAKGISHQQIADHLDLTRQAVHRMFQVENLKLAQFESICQLGMLNPCDFFDDVKQVQQPEIKLLNEALQDKIKLQQDVITLLREQLADCKARVDNLALTK